jgi:hypothetical protein
MSIIRNTDIAIPYQCIISYFYYSELLSKIGMNKKVNKKLLENYSHNSILSLHSNSGEEVTKIIVCKYGIYIFYMLLC